VEFSSPLRVGPCCGDKVRFAGRLNRTDCAAATGKPQHPPCSAPARLWLAASRWESINPGQEKGDFDLMDKSIHNLDRDQHFSAVNQQDILCSASIVRKTTISMSLLPPVPLPELRAQLT
jgi:hypothetical protein